MLSTSTKGATTNSETDFKRIAKTNLKKEIYNSHASL